MRLARLLIAVLIAGTIFLTLGSSRGAQTNNPARKAKKVYMVTDMEGVDGIFDSELQCVPNKSPRWEESRKLLTDEINAAVDGLLEGGATDVTVWDGHYAGGNLSVLDIHPRVRLLTGRLMGYIALNPSYSALVFVGQHAMAGAKNGVLSHSESSEGIQNIWVNGRPTGEIGINALLAGSFGVPAVMLAGDTAACEEIRELSPKAECAVVKEGVSRNAAYMLPHAAALALIRQAARTAMQHLDEYKPYTIAGPVEVRVESTPNGFEGLPKREGVTRIDERIWAFRGKDFVEAFQKWSTF